MEPTKPLYEIGETVIIFPIHGGPGTAMKGLETIVLEREWAKAYTYSGGYEYCWGYRTDILPPPIHDSEGVERQPWGWCEYNLRKKHEPGDPFNELMEELKEPALQADKV